MEQFSTTTFADAIRAVGRYKPIVAIVIALIALSAILPDAARVGENDFDEFASAPLASDFPYDAAPPDEAAAAAAAGGDPLAVGGTTAVDRSGAASFQVRSIAGGPSASSSYTPPPAAFTPPTAPSPTSAPRARQPLTVAAAGWATAAAGTPLGSADVPDGSLPVGRRASQDDKRSFVRLAGDESVLFLTPVEGAGQRLADQAAILACRITDPTWNPEDGVAMDTAPAYDTHNCVSGERQDDGRWSFDLARFEDRTDQRGFALVPDPATIDFQVAFQRG